MLVAVLRELFPVLAVLYLVDSLAWVGALNLLFVHWPWGWRATRGRGLRLAGLLPFDLTITAAGPVVIATSEALYLPDSDAEGGSLYDPGRWTRLDYDQATTQREDASVLLAGGHRVRFPSAAHAESFLDLLADLRPLAPAARAKRLAQQRRRAFDLGAASKRLDAFREETAFLRVVVWGLFFLLLLMLPAILYLHPAPERLLGPLTVGILLSYAGSLMVTVHTGSRLKKDGVLRRSVSIVPMIFSPVSVVRAVPVLARDVLHGFDVLLVAAALLRKERFAAQARAELHGAASAAAQGDEGWRRHWEARRQAVLGLLGSLEIGEAEALAPPARRDPTAESWCPVCGTESREAGGLCDDCGLPLASLRPPIQPDPAGPGQESVWDYPRPPRVEDSARHVQVWLNGVLIADTHRAKRVLETSHPPTWYIPPEDVRREHLFENKDGSWCEWKGLAHYCDVEVAGVRAVSAAWLYQQPTRMFEELQGYIAFHPHLMELCTVDGERVTPQPGGFYGGWVTSDVAGPFKGGPGSADW